MVRLEIMRAGFTLQGKNPKKAISQILLTILCKKFTFSKKCFAATNKPEKQ